MLVEKIILCSQKKKNGHPDMTDVHVRHGGIDPASLATSGPVHSGALPGSGWGDLPPLQVRKV